MTVRRATRRGSSAEQCDSMVGLWVIIHYTHLHAAHDFSICSSMTHASLFVSALSRRRRWPSRASRPLVPLYIYVYIRLRANSARPESRIEAPLSEWESPFRFRSTDEGRHHDTRDALPLRVYFITHVVVGVGGSRDSLRSHHCSNAARESDSGHISLLTQTVAHSHLPEGGARVTDAAGTLPHR